MTVILVTLPLVPCNLQLTQRRRWLQYFASGSELCGNQSESVGQFSENKLGQVRLNACSQ